MGLMDQVTDVLKQYAGGSAQVPSNVNEHFDQVAQVAPPSSIAEGRRLSAPIRPPRSDRC